RVCLFTTRAGDDLRRCPPLHADLLLVDLEAFGLADVPDAGEQPADALRILLPLRHQRVAGEGEVVGVARIGPAQLRGDPAQAAVEPPGRQVGQRGARAGALGQRPRAGGDVVRLPGILDDP